MPTAILIGDINISVKSLSFMMTAPRIAGMESRKEYFAAISGEFPSNSANEIVDHDLEIPGIIARPCTNPINGVCQAFRTWLLLCLRNLGS